MKILAIGDPHGNLEKIKKIPIEDIDLILLVGDLGKADLARKRFFENLKRKEKGLPELKVTNQYRKREYLETYTSAIQVGKYLSKIAPVYTIFGNADNSNQEVRKKSKKLKLDLPFLYNDLNSIPRFQVINNRIVNVSGVKIGGLEYFIDTSWVKDFKPVEYEKRLKEAKRETEKARKILNRFGTYDANIFLCHQPPQGYLDESNFSGAPASWKGKHAGSKVILDYIKKYQPKYVFCGHIHEGEGRTKIGKTEVYNLGVAGYKIVEI
jgi:Icc-related predicted phosphoesterase